MFTVIANASLTGNCLHQRGMGKSSAVGASVITLSRVVCDMGNLWVFLPRPVPLPMRYPDPQRGSRFLQPFSWVWVWVKIPTGVGMGACSSGIEKKFQVSL